MSWKKVEPPRTKAEWRYKHLRLLALPPRQVTIGKPELPVKIGDVVRIFMRRSYDDAGNLWTHDISEWPRERILEVEWGCPHCGHMHRSLIPESWITEGRAEFVEKDESPDGERT